MAEKGKLTGKHVFGALFAFFAVIMAANGVFLTMALKTFPGEQEEKSYLQGLNYNERLAKRRRQAALGWSVAVERATLSGGTAEIMLRVTEASDTPLNSLTVSGSLFRPVDDDFDYVASFETAGDGLYRASVPDMAPGQWRLNGEAVDRTGQTFEFSSTLVFE